MSAITADPPSQSNPLPTALASSLPKRSTAQEPPVQNGWSRPLGPGQISSTLKSGHVQQGTPLDNGGMTSHNCNDNFSTLPTALSPSSSTVSFPNGFTQQSPPATQIVPHPTWTKTSKPNFHCINFTINLFSPRRSYAWFLAVDQDGMVNCPQWNCVCSPLPRICSKSG